MGCKPRNEISNKKILKTQVSMFTFKKSFLENYLILEEFRLLWDFTFSSYHWHSGMNTNEESLGSATE